MIQIGPFLVEGAPPKRQAWVRSALASLDTDVDPNVLLPRPVPLVFGPVGNIPGTNSPAVGYTVAGPRTEVRHGMTNAPNLSRDTTEYTTLHEGLGHARMRLRPFSKDQWKRLKALVKGPLGTGYWFRDLEVIIDAMVEAISGVDSPYRFDPTRPLARSHYQHWIDEADYPIVKAIWLEPPPVVPDPEPEEPPVPLPDPVDPCAEAVGVVTAQLNAERQAHEAAKGQLATAESRLEAKDQKMQEALSL